MRKINWGVLSSARIAINNVIPAMNAGKYSQVQAIASRNARKAKTLAKKLGLPKWYDCYEALLQDDEIDAIYNPLPNHLHVPWTLKALHAGKHVLCEKPIALSADEAMLLLQVAKEHPHLKVMEAFMYRFHPQWQKAVQLLRSGKIGSLRHVQSTFTYHNPNPADIRNLPGMGGGGLMDVGCYSISLSRYLFQSEPLRVMAMMEFDPVFQVDRLASGLLEFSRGTASFTCATQLESYQRVHIFGDRGMIEIEIPFNPPTDRRCRIWLHIAEKIREISIPVSDHYTIQGDLFSRAILKNSPVPTPLEDAVANMRVIERVFASAKESRWDNL